MAAVASTADRLRELHEMRPRPGLIQCAVRLGGQAALVVGALWAFAHDDYPVYAVLGTASAVWYGSLLSLTHDALHHRLTGIVVVDDIVARLIAWPVGWPIGLFTRLHLGHHRWAGASLRDPERIQPTRTEYRVASRPARWYFRNQVWLNVCVVGGVGLLVRVVLDARRSRAHVHSLRKYVLIDAVGVLAMTGAWAAAAYQVGGWRLAAAVAGLWIATERIAGAVHQARKHAEHYGLWGTAPTRMETQYQSARDIDAGPLASWYFNHLNRHATHHALVGVPFFNLEAAHTYLHDTLAARAQSRLTPGYLAGVIAAHRLARHERFIDAEPGQEGS